MRPRSVDGDARRKSLGNVLAATEETAEAATTASIAILADIVLVGECGKGGERLLEGRESQRQSSWLALKKDQSTPLLAPVPTRRAPPPPPPSTHAPNRDSQCARGGGAERFVPLRLNRSALGLSQCLSRALQGHGLGSHGGWMTNNAAVSYTTLSVLGASSEQSAFVGTFETQR